MAFGNSQKAAIINVLSDWHDEGFEVIRTILLDFGKLDGRLNARGGQACLAQARQDRPGIGELDLTEFFVTKP